MLSYISVPLALIGLAISLGLLAAGALLCVDTVLRGPLVRKPLFLLRDAAVLLLAVFWSLFLALAAGGLTFTQPTALALRWVLAVLSVPALLLALLEHDWTLLLPGLFPLLTLPFFETAFGTAFPYVLLAMLALTLAEAVVRLLRSRARQADRLSLASIQEAVDTLDDGLLFAEADGRILLSNRTMAQLCTSLCHQPLENANTFWHILEESASTDFVTKISSEGSFLFRFTGGNTWTLHRETFPLEDRAFTQIVALNVTESDAVQRQITARRLELSRTAEQLAQVEATIARLQEAEALVNQGRETFDSITGKMAALSRFFSEHYAIPAGTFDYKRLSELTAGLLRDMAHAAPLTPQQQLDLTVSALALLGVDIACEGALPEDPAAAAAVAHLIREASVNAVLHGGASSVTAVLTREDGALCCRVENNGAVQEDAPLTPGEGITSIRRLLFPLNGTLEITRVPVFALQIRIPNVN